MLSKKVVIVLFAYQSISAMEPARAQPKTIIKRYNSVVPSRLSGVPPLKLLAAQKLQEMKDNGELTLEQLTLFASKNNAQSSSPEESICNDALQQNFSHMRKDAAEQYACDLAGGRVPRSGSSGRVAQKILALEIKTKINKQNISRT